MTLQPNNATAHNGYGSTEGYLDLSRAAKLVQGQAKLDDLGQGTIHLVGQEKAKSEHTHSLLVSRVEQSEAARSEPQAESPFPLWEVFEQVRAFFKGLLDDYEALRFKVNLLTGMRVSGKSRELRTRWAIKYHAELINYEIARLQCDIGVGLDQPDLNVVEKKADQAIRKAYNGWDTYTWSRFKAEIEDLKRWVEDTERRVAHLELRVNDVGQAVEAVQEAVAHE